MGSRGPAPGLVCQPVCLFPAALRAEGPPLPFPRLHLPTSSAFLWKRPQHLLLCLPPQPGGWSLASAALSPTFWGPWAPRQMKRAAVPSPPQSASRPPWSHGPSRPLPTCCASRRLRVPTSRASTATKWAAPCSGSGGLRPPSMPWTRPSASCRPAGGGGRRAAAGAALGKRTQADACRSLEESVQGLHVHRAWPELQPLPTSESARRGLDQGCVRQTFQKP